LFADDTPKFLYIVCHLTWCDHAHRRTYYNNSCTDSVLTSKRHVSS